MTIFPLIAAALAIRSITPRQTSFGFGGGGGGKSKTPRKKRSTRARAKAPARIKAQAPVRQLAASNPRGEVDLSHLQSVSKTRSMKLPNGDTLVSVTKKIPGGGAIIVPRIFHTAKAAKRGARRRSKLPPLQARLVDEHDTVTRSPRRKYRKAKAAHKRPHKRSKAELHALRLRNLKKARAARKKKTHGKRRYKQLPAKAVCRTKDGRIKRSAPVKVCRTKSGRFRKVRRS